MKKELLSYFKESIEDIAARYEISQEEMKAKLKKNYDGYRFSEEGSDIYNPWSILNCLADKKKYPFIGMRPDSPRLS